MNNIKDISEIDIRLKLLAGDSFYIDGIGEIKPLTLNEIKNIGYTNYMRYLNLFTVNVEDFFNKENIPDNIKINIFDLIINSGNQELINEFINALKIFIREEKIYLHIESNLIFLGEIYDEINKNKIITRNNFEELIKIIKLQNYLVNIDKDKYNPKNEKAKKIIEKLKKAKQAINKSKKNDDNENIDFADIVSAVSTKSNHINKKNIWNLTMYQLIDEYNRLNMIDQYDINIRSLLAGADSKKIKIKHWMSKIDQ